MNFQGDDPLADLFGDNSSDNDSFFENPSSNFRSKSKSSINIGKGKNKTDSLFGIKEETESRTDFKPTSLRRQSPTPNVSKRQPATSTPRITTQNPSQTNEENDNDDNDDLGFDPKQPRANAIRSNLFDDLLAIDVKRPIISAPAASRREETTKPIISRQSTDTTDNSTNLLTTSTRPKTSMGHRSSSHSVVPNLDPLGLFGTGTVTAPSNDNMPNSSGMSTPKPKRRSNTADWLGLNAEREENAGWRGERLETSNASLSNDEKLNDAVEKVEILKLPEKSDNEPPVEATNLSTIRQIQQNTFTIPNNTAQNILLLNSMHVESANAYAALKQQESHLELAAQMKKQERVLIEMQRKQEKLLQQQDRQFEALLQQQLQRQSQLEEHIKQQQERINLHMQLMMTQPSFASGLPTSEISCAAADREEVTLKNKIESSSASDLCLNKIQQEAEIKRLELEKLRLEELVANQKTNYEREIEMIEESYKKQLKIAEEQFVAVESRLKAELEDQSQFFSKKIENLEADREKLKSDYENEMSLIGHEHDEEIKKLRKSQDDDLDLLKEDHRRMLDNIRQSKVLEFATVQENGSYLDLLRSASSNLEELSGDLHGLRDEMQLKMETINKERERKLEARERRVEDAEKRLKITEETAEEEKRRLMELVSTLEVQLNKLTKDSSEENWQLRQKMASLEADKCAFEKEKQFMREQLTRDEKRIAQLKEQQLAEIQNMKLEFQEDRAALLVERTKLETERKLQPLVDFDRERLEVEASLKVAHDAAFQADQERERYQRLQRQLEQQKRDLTDKENLLRAKEEELEQELNSFRVAERKSQEAQQKAQLVEQNFQTKIQFLLQRMSEIGEKEANVTQERVLLVKERIALQNLRSKLSSQKCTLCKMTERNDELSSLLNVSTSYNGEGVPSAVVPSGTTNETNYRHLLGDTNFVDRMFDENIAESYRKMKANTAGNMPEFWTETGLDDDTKELAKHNLENT